MGPGSLGEVLLPQVAASCFSKYGFGLGFEGLGVASRTDYSCTHTHMHVHTYYIYIYIYIYIYMYVYIYICTYIYTCVFFADFPAHKGLQFNATELERILGMLRLPSLQVLGFRCFRHSAARFRYRAQTTPIHSRRKSLRDWAWKDGRGRGRQLKGAEATIRTPMKHT